MRKLFTVRGWRADGRTLGLGLAVAMERQRQEAARNATVGAEDYLRQAAEDRDVTSPSA